jgi:hypothetical protein
MDLILKCIDNYPQARAHASEIVGRLAEMVLQFPASFANRLDEALRQNEAMSKENQDQRREIGTLRQEKRTLREEVERKDRLIQELRMENELLKIENKTTELNLRDNISPSQVSLYIVIVVHAQDVNFVHMLSSSRKVPRPPVIVVHACAIKPLIEFESLSTGYMYEHKLYMYMH